MRLTLMTAVVAAVVAEVVAAFETGLPFFFLLKEKARSMKTHKIS